MRAAKWAAVVVTVVSFGSIASAAEPGWQPETPRWTWESGAAIEWAEPVGDANDVRLLVATRGAGLHVVDAKSGRSLLSAPIIARPGVVAAPRSPDGGTQVTYCVDRFQAYAIDLGPPAALRWRVGTWPPEVGPATAPAPDPEQVFQGDPEQLRRIVSAHACAEGLLLFRDDGRAALLDRATGRVRWELRLARSPTARWHVCGQTAALLWQDAGRLEAALVTISDGERRDMALSGEVSWPAWSALTEYGLLMAHAERLSLWQLAGLRWDFKTDSAVHILAGTVLRFDRAETTTKGAGTALVVFGSTDGQLHTLDVKTGAFAWSVKDQADTPAHWSLVRIDDDLLLAATEHAMHVRSVATAALLGDIVGSPAERLRDVARSGPVLSLVWLETSGPRPGLRVDQYDRSAELASGAPRARHDLGPAESFLRMLWTPDRAIVVTRHELRAYALR